MDTTTSLEADRDRIKELGGPANVARLLNFDLRRGGIQRVQNWIARGIPSHIKVKHPDIFMRGTAKPEATAGAEGGA